MFASSRLARCGAPVSSRIAALALSVSAFAFMAPLAYAQDVPAQTAPAQPVPAQPAAPEEDVEEGDVIIVTGTILRGNENSVSPVGTVTAEDMQIRGQTTIADTVQTLSGNNAGALPNSFTANGAFAAGASGTSLRGLLTSNTLVLVDGLRPAYYPLADDGTRNFVDLNTIPQGVVQRIDVLKDGASSTYGADAIAGVINVITRREFQGLQLDVAQGMSEAGGADQAYLSGLWGFGDLGEDDYNFYVAFEYQRDDALRNSERDFPFNTSNLSSWCATSIIPAYGETCGLDGRFWSVQPESNALNNIGHTTVAMVRPYDATNTTGLGDWRLLNAADGCRDLTPTTITPEQAANGGFDGFDNPVAACLQDPVAQYGQITPENDRFSLSGRFTFQLDSGAEVYAMGTYYQNEVFAPGIDQPIVNITTPAATGVQVDTIDIALPVFVCGAGAWNYVCDGSEADAALNPNNPFAGDGQVARIRYRFGDLPQDIRYFSQSFRGAGGIRGEFDLSGQAFEYDFELSAMQTNLHKVSRGFLWYPGLLGAINQGTYNFVDPEENTEAVRNSIAPELIQDSTSKLIQAQLSLTTDLFEMRAGPVVGGVMVQARYESLDNPSENSDELGAENRYFTVNPFGASGSRDTQSIAFEVQAPLLETLDVNVSGRFDQYSSGQSAFSPKFGVRFRPLEFLMLRGTYSEGFRIPSFAESFAVPTTGFIAPNAPEAWCLANHGATNAPYCTGYALGLTQVSSPDLEPEESTNINLGFVVELFDHWTFSADWYQIEIENTIGGADPTPAIDAYYNGDPIPPGFAVTPGIPDPAFPAAPPTLGFVRYSFQNLGTRHADGWDFQVTGNYELGAVQWTTVVEATFLNSLTQSLGPGQPEQEYAGTIGPYIITAASGTPQWRANWQNTFTMGPATFGVTMYYTDGYKSSAEDVGGDSDDCNTPPVTHYYDGATPLTCEVDPSFFVDLHGGYDITEELQLYLDVGNVFDEAPALDTTTYGAFNYNPAWGTPGILGRYFTIGARARF
jgi:iron complex outermembrane recepter protein